MVSKYPLRVIFILLFSIITFRVAAQPTLPDITGAADNGIVILTWNCQYAAVKSIAVLRSADSINGYTAIGNVKKLDKGVQAFADGHPANGKNFYKLIILFNSGLTWSSNHCSVIVSLPSAAQTKLPVNDSLQRYITTGDTVKGRTLAAATPIVKQENKSQTNVTATKNETTEPKGKQVNNTNAQSAVTNNKVFVSFDMDTTHAAPKSSTDVTPKPEDHRPHFTLTFTDTATTTPMFVKNRFIATDPVTGHINMTLPDDVATHHYSIKFYNDQNQVVIEIPKINAAKIIIDKRNFRHRGTYRFVIRKDVTELESGYVILN